MRGQRCTVDVVVRRAGIELRGDEPFTTAAADERKQVPDDYWPEEGGCTRCVVGGGRMQSGDNIWASSFGGGLRRERIVQTSGPLSNDPFPEWLPVWRPGSNIVWRGRRERIRNRKLVIVANPTIIFITISIVNGRFSSITQASSDTDDISAGRSMY